MHKYHLNVSIKLTALWFQLMPRSYIIQRSISPNQSVSPVSFANSYLANQPTLALNIHVGGLSEDEIKHNAQLFKVHIFSKTDKSISLISECYSLVTGILTLKDNCILDGCISGAFAQGLK